MTTCRLLTVLCLVAVAAPALAEGEPLLVVGELSSSSRVLDGGRYANEHTITLPEGAHATVRLASSALDTMLFIETPDGQMFSNDDVSSNNLSSLLELSADAGGVYKIYASTYEAGVTGSYKLVVELTGAAINEVAMAASAREPQMAAHTVVAPEYEAPHTGTGSAGRQGQGKVLGVFVGINQYASGNNLEGCAEDAQRVEASLRSQGQLAERDYETLTDGEATVANVRRAIETIGARVRANDVFVFFYSGHGAQVAAVRRGEESDSLDETIILRDGVMRDDELDALLDRVQSDTTVVALDSCHSGGFASDLEGARRLGFFSSDEDVLSSTAPRYGAGGFLAHFVSEAFRGAANGNDGSLRVGNLSNYLHQQYAVHRAEMGTRDDDGFETNQNLIVTRGAALGDLLWRNSGGSNLVAMADIGKTF